MGCDIHAHIEILVDGKWEHYAALSLPRNYALFTKLAGVRDVKGITPIAPPRGLPTDITFVTKLDLLRCGTCYHTPSWITAEEAEEVEMWCLARNPATPQHPPYPWGYLFDNSMLVKLKLPDNQPQHTATRVVFWFDH